MPTISGSQTIGVAAPPVAWYRKPGGSVHAFRGVRTVCERFTWQASWTSIPREAIAGDEVCSVCLAMVVEDR